MALATLTIDIVAKLADLQTGFDRAAQVAERNSQRMQSAFGALKTGIAGLGIGAVVYKVVSSLDDAFEKLDQLSKRAQDFALPAEFLSGLDITAKAAGIDDIDRALVKFTATLADARNGSAQAEKVVSALGISVKGLRDGSIDTETALKRAADAVRGYADGFAKGNLVQEAFGARNQRLISLLNEGADGLDKFGGASRESIENAARLKDEIDKLVASFEKLKLSIAGELAATLNDLFDPRDAQIKQMRSEVASIQAQLAAKPTNETWLDKLWDRSGELTKRLEYLKAQLDKLGAGAGTAVEDRSAGVVKPQAPNTRVDTAAASAAQSFLDSLKKRVDLITQGEFATLRLEAAQKGLAAAAEPYIARLERMKKVQAEIADSVKEQQRLAREDEQASAFDRALRNELETLKTQGEQIGANARQVALLNAQRAIEAQYVERLRQLDTEDSAGVVRAIEARNRALAQLPPLIDISAMKAQSASLDELLQQIEDETRLMGAGTAERQRSILLRGLEKAGIDATVAGYDELIAKINEIGAAIDLQDRIARVKQAFDDLGRAIAGNLENAIVQWRGFGDLIRSLEQDIIRIITRLLVTEPLARSIAGVLGGAFGGGGSIASGIGALFGAPENLVGVFAAGTDYVPRTGLALVHQGEKIIPATDNRNADRSASVTVVQNFAFSAPVSRETQSQVAAAAARGMRVAVDRGF